MSRTPVAVGSAAAARRRSARAAVAAIAIAAFFFLWHSPLLSTAGRVRGLNSDAAIIALMGKKMLEGRGFDVFFWGQNYIGPLTSMFAAGAGLVRGGVDPLAFRLGCLAEVLAGILVFTWAVVRIDGRAALAVAAALCLTPGAVLRMMFSPLGAEMAFLCSALVTAVVLQHLTAGDGRGWLSHPAGQMGFGALAGLSWWMNQQIAFALLAAAIVLGFRSELVRRLAAGVRLRDRLLLRGEALGWRPLPGLIEAAVWLSTRIGLLLLLAAVGEWTFGVRLLPFLLGPFTDALLLLLVPHVVLLLAQREWRSWRLAPTARERDELTAALRFATGALMGYAPVWLGGLLGWYPEAYAVGSLRVGRPAEVLARIGAVAAEFAGHALGAAAGAWGAAWVVGFLVTAGIAVGRARRSAPHLYLAAGALANLGVVAVCGGKPHYYNGSVGMVLALSALGACALYDRGRLVGRATVVAAGLAALLSIAASSRAWHAQVLAEPDPLPLLDRVHEAGCDICYADYWLAYRYRFLDGERARWIPYASQNRTRSESEAIQRLPGQRCLVGGDGTVTKLDGDLPLRFDPPGLARHPRRAAF